MVSRPGAIPRGETQSRENKRRFYDRIEMHKLKAYTGDVLLWCKIGIMSSYTLVVQGI